MSPAPHTLADEGMPHPSSFIAEELDARNWSTLDVARRMPGEVWRNQMCLDLYLAVGGRKDKPPTSLRFGDRMARDLGLAFGVSPELFLNLERAWLKEQGDDRPLVERPAA